MKLILKRLRTIKELYENQLQMLLSAEEQIAQLLLDMQGWASDEELRSMIQTFRQETELQVPRIRELVSANENDTNPIRCKVVAALAAEAEDMIADAADPAVRDVALIAAAQRVKHYEIAVYGTIRTFAEILGEEASAELLEKSLREEKEADRLLSVIADRINALAPDYDPQPGQAETGVGKLSGH